MVTDSEMKELTADILENIQFADVLNIEELQQMQDLFSDATGVASLITLPDGTPLTNPSNFCRLCSNIIRKTEKGLANCYHSDAMIGRHSPSGAILWPCLSGGLWDAGASITIGGKHIANWLVGQVRNEDLDEKRMIKYADEIGANKKEFMEALNEVPVMSVEQLGKISKMLFVFANQISEKAYKNLQLKLQIEQQKKATKELQESEERYKSLFQNNHAVMLLINNKTFNIVDANPAACRYYGWPHDKIITLKITDINTLTPEEVSQEMRLALDEKRNHFHFKHRHADGKISDVEVYSGPISINGQELLYSLVHDITDRVQAEAEINLKNQQLLELNAEKDKFFSIIAHDLRGPINTFLGLTQVMTEDLPNLTMDKIQKFTKSMRNSASNLIRLLENLLQWARMQQGLIPFNPEPVQLHNFVNETIEMVYDTAQNKEIEILNNIPANIQITADQNLLKTVFRNLLSNAIKFSPRGGKVIFSSKTKENGCTEISIEDTGIGLNAEMVENLFRFDVKINRKGTEGELSTGLGLLLCKEFIEKHGGSIWAESLEGKGSTFYFTIPWKIFPFPVVPITI